VGGAFRAPGCGVTTRAMTGTAIADDGAGGDLGHDDRADMAIGLIVVLLVLALGAIPAWPHSRDWGYYPSSALAAALLILLALVLTGRL